MYTIEIQEDICIYLPKDIGQFRCVSSDFIDLFLMSQIYNKE